MTTKYTSDWNKVTDGSRTSTLMGSIPKQRWQLQKTQADPRLLRKMLSIFLNELILLSVLPLVDIPLHDDSHRFNAFMLTTARLIPGLSQRLLRPSCLWSLPITRSVPLTLPFQPLDAFHPRLPRFLNFMA